MALGGAGAALLLGACGFGTAAQAHHAPNLAALYHQAAQCVRDHGYPNFPDPTIDSNGKAQLPPGVQPPAPEVVVTRGGSLWPKSAAAWLLLTVILIAAAAQSVSPTRRWRLPERTAMRPSQESGQPQ